MLNANVGDMTDIKAHVSVNFNKIEFYIGMKSGMKLSAT